MRDQAEVTDKENNLLRQVNSLVEFGKKNGGWGSLLEMKEVENMIFQIDISWQEIMPLMTEKDISKHDDIKNAINIINTSYTDLKDLKQKIEQSINTLRDSKHVQKKDAGVVLQALQHKGVLEDLFPYTQNDIIDLLALMQEFQSLYLKWTNSKGNFKKLLNSLDEYRNNSMSQRSGGLRSRFPKNSERIIKRTNSDNRWGWSKDRH